MRERWPSRNEDGAHKWMLVIVAMEPTRMIDFTILLAFLNVEFVLVDNCPASLGNDPKGCDAVVLGEVVPLGHVLVTKIDLDVWIILGSFLDLVIETVEIGRLLWSETVERPAIDMRELGWVDEVLKLCEAGYIGCCHAVVGNYYDVDDVGEIAFVEALEYAP